LPDDGPRRDFIVSADQGNSGDPHSGAGSATSASYKGKARLHRFCNRKASRQSQKTRVRSVGAKKDSPFPAVLEVVGLIGKVNRVNVNLQSKNPSCLIGKTGEKGTGRRLDAKLGLLGLAMPGGSRVGGRLAFGFASGESIGSAGGRLAPMCCAQSGGSSPPTGSDSSAFSAFLTGVWSMTLTTIAPCGRQENQSHMKSSAT
jgi:hypothetical protein